MLGRNAQNTEFVKFRTFETREILPQTALDTSLPATLLAVLFYFVLGEIKTILTRMRHI